MMAAPANNPEVPFMGSYTLAKDGIKKDEFVEFLKQSGIGMIKRNAAWALVGTSFAFNIVAAGDGKITFERTKPAKCEDTVNISDSLAAGDGKITFERTKPAK